MGTTVQDDYLKNFGLDVNAYDPAPNTGQDQPATDQQAATQDQAPPEQQTPPADQAAPDQEPEQDQPPADQQTAAEDQASPDRETDGQDQPVPEDTSSGASTQTPADATATNLSCYRNRFNGIYKTFAKGDIVFVVKDWTLIHAGACQCEGKVAGLECTEPGDDGAAAAGEQSVQDETSPDQAAATQDPLPDQQTSGQHDPSTDQQTAPQDQPPPDQQTDGKDQPPPDQQTAGQGDASTDQKTAVQDDDPAPSSVSADADVLDPDAIRKAAAKVVAQGAEADDWLRTYLRGNNLGPDRVGDGSGKTVMFGNKTTPLATVISTTLAAGRIANLKLGGNDLITADRVQRIVTQILLAADPHVPGSGPARAGRADPRQVSMYLQYTFIPTTVHTPTGGGSDSKDQPGHSLTGQLTMEYHAGLEISVLGQATWFADEKGGHLTNQSGFTGAQVAWVWTFADGAFQAGPQFQALVGASKAQNKLTNKLEWAPTGQVGAGGQVQYAIPGLGGHVLVGIQAGVSATDPKGGDSTVDKSVGLTFTYKF